jgi:hypothetical protein
MRAAIRYPTPNKIMGRAATVDHDDGKTRDSNKLSGKEESTTSNATNDIFLGLIIVGC